jgi:PAS domain S-box-containing protein
MTVQRDSPNTTQALDGSGGPQPVGRHGVLTPSAADAIRRALGLLVPRAADYAFLHVVSVDNGFSVGALRHRDKGLESVLERFLSDGLERMTAPGSVIARALEGGVPIVSEVGPAPGAHGAGDDRLPAALLGPRSYLALPVGHDGTVLGVLTLARFETETPYNRRDVPLGGAVAGELGLLLAGESVRARERARGQALEAEIAAVREALEAEVASVQEGHEAELETMREAMAAEVAAARGSLEEEVASVRHSLENEVDSLKQALDQARRRRVASDEAQERAISAVVEAEAARAAAEAALGEALERTRIVGQEGLEARLLDAVGEAVVAVDLEGRVVYWNRAAEGLYGWSKDEALGRDLAETAHAVASPEQATEAIERMMSGGGWSGEMRIRRKDGSTVPVSLSGGPLFDADGEPMGIVSVATELRGSRPSEERTLQTERAQAVGRVAGGVAHEFNNCLTTISGYTELMRRELEGEDPLAEDLTAIEEAADRAARLVQQLLAYTRRQVLRPRVTGLNQIISAMEPTLRSITGEGPDLVLELGADPDLISVDPAQIEQAVIQLVTNAVEAVPPDGRVSIHTDTVELTEAETREFKYPVEAGPYVSLVVKDNGSGMDPDTREHAFEPFFTTKEDRPASGLGLSTVYGIVKQSGGYVWLSSAPGKGTTVRVVLPLTSAEESTGDRSALEESPRGSSRTVLVVEDDGAIRDFARRVLTADGHDVIVAENGIEALRLWDRRHDEVDLVVTDVVMPWMSGRALVDRLRATRPDLPVLFVSGYTGDAAESGPRPGAAAGRDPILDKPFPAEALSRRVQDLLGDEGSETEERGAHSTLPGPDVDK